MLEPTKYLQAVVAMAGLKVTPVEGGLPVEIAARWNGVDWDAPILSSVTNEYGTLGWTSLTNRLFRRTFEPLTDTFRAIHVPAGVYSMAVMIHPVTKKPHFVNVRRWDMPRIPDVPERVSVTAAPPLPVLLEGLKQLGVMRRRLWGIGYAD